MNLDLIKQEIGTIQGIIMDPLQQASAAISNYVPRIIAALVVIVTGWLVAIVLRKVTGKACRALGFNVIAERTGIATILQRGGIQMRPAELLGFGIYWLILFSALVATFNALGLDMASLLLQAIATYIPHLLIGLLLLGLGFLASRYIATMVTATATAVNLPAPQVWSLAAQSLILFMTGVLVLSELGITTRIVSLSFLVLLGVAGIAAALACGQGARGIVEQLIAGQGLRQFLHPGDTVQYDHYEGTIQEVGYTHVSLHTDQGIVTVPNTVLLSATIIKRPFAPAPWTASQPLRAERSRSQHYHRGNRDYT